MTLVGVVVDIAGDVWWVPVEGDPVREGRVEPKTLGRIGDLVDRMPCGPMRRDPSEVRRFPERKVVNVDPDPLTCRDCTMGPAQQRPRIKRRGTGTTQYFNDTPVPEGAICAGEGIWETLNDASGYLSDADADALYESVHSFRMQVEGRWKERLPEKYR